MAELDLDAIEARANAADGGPWRVVAEHGRDIADEAYTRLTIQTDQPGNSREIAEVTDPEQFVASERPEENAEFIAAARTDVPALVAEVRRLRQGLISFEKNCTATAAEFDQVPGADDLARILRAIAVGARAYLAGGA